MIKISDLKFDIKEGNSVRRILDIEDLSFKDSKINVVSGPSGSGKTTLLYALAGILNINEGKVFYNETSIYDLNIEQKDKFRMDNISMVYQNYNLFSFMNVEENILVPYYVRGKKIVDEVLQEVNSLLSVMKLENINQKPINALSGGEQQRVAIIRSIIGKPRVILCDEPTANLDSENTLILMERLVELNKKSKTTIVIATHDEKVMKYAENHIHMVDGTIVH